MANINASALNSLQTRINAERSRRSLSPVTFTDGTHDAGDVIKATHFNELRSYTEGLNTLGSQTFNWSGDIAVGASITDVLTQIDNFVTTLEGEVLASWHTLTPASTWNGLLNVEMLPVPASAYSAGLVRWKTTYSLTVPQGGVVNTARLLRSRALTFTSEGYTGGWHNLMLHIHAGLTSDTFGGHPMTGSNFQPWIGSFGDNTQYPDQTPYTSLSGKGSQTSDAGKFNTEAGTIAHSDSYRWYQCNTNHWYYSQEDFTSTFNTVLFMHNSTSPVNYLTGKVEIQAYY